MEVCITDREFVSELVKEWFLLTIGTRLGFTEEVLTHDVHTLLELVANGVEDRTLILGMIFACRILICCTEHLVSDSKTKVVEMVEHLRERTAFALTTTFIGTSKIIKDCLSFSFRECIEFRTTETILTEQPIGSIGYFTFHPLRELIESPLHRINGSGNNRLVRITINTEDNCIHTFVNLIDSPTEQIEWFLENTGKHITHRLKRTIFCNLLNPVIRSTERGLLLGFPLCI